MSSRTAQQLPLASIPPTTGGGRSSDGAAVRTMRVTSSPSRAVRTAEAVVHPQRAEAVTASPGARHRLFHRDVGRLRVHDGARWTPDGQWRAEDRRAGWRGCQTRLPGPSPHAAPCDGLQTRQRRAGHPGRSSTTWGTRTSPTRPATRTLRPIGSRPSGGIEGTDPGRGALAPTGGNKEDVPRDRCPTGRQVDGGTLFAILSAPPYCTAVRRRARGGGAGGRGLTFAASTTRLLPANG